MFISVYAIAKDEEALAQRWYNCFKEADEVCVLDTGSSDKTVRILRKLGARVRVKKYKEWRFDVARNDSMRMCSEKADLLFCADLDDVIEHGWRKKIEKMWNCCTSKGIIPSAVQYEYAVRYVRNGKEWLQKQFRHNIHSRDGWGWRFRVHEQLCFCFSEKPSVVEIHDLNMTSCPLVEKDHSSYLGMIQKDIDDNPEEKRLIHLLGREYMNIGDYDKAIAKLKWHLYITDVKGARERTASMKFLSECYRQKKQYELMELYLWKASAEDEQDRDALFTLGKWLLTNHVYRQAFNVLKKCVAIEDIARPIPSYCPDSWTAMPYFYLSEAAYYSGDVKLSLEMVNKGLSMEPDNKTAIQFKNEVESVLRGQPSLTGTPKI